MTCATRTRGNYSVEQMGAGCLHFQELVLLHWEAIVREVRLRFPNLLTILRWGQLSVGILYMIHIRIHIASRHHDALISTFSNERFPTALNPDNA